MYRYIVLLHILGATIWTGGHLYLALRILPSVLRRRSSAMLLEFEQRFEPLGMPALAVQVLSGLWLAQHLVPVRMWFILNNHASQMITAKFILLAITLGLAIDARFRVIPRLNDQNVGSMAWHIAGVTTAGVLLVAAGVGIRTGGWW